MKTKKGFKKGFTLVEMMIVVAIIAILASMAVPKFMTNIRKSEATEAIRLMKQISDAEGAFFSSHGKYSEDIGVLGIDLNTEGNFNTYHIKACGTDAKDGVVIEAINSASSNSFNRVYMFYPKSAVDINGTSGTTADADYYDGTAYLYNYINRIEGEKAPSEDCKSLGSQWK